MYIYKFFRHKTFYIFIHIYNIYTEFYTSSSVIMETSPKPGQGGLEKGNAHGKGKVLSPSHPSTPEWNLHISAWEWMVGSEPTKDWRARGEGGDDGGWELCREGLRKWVLLGMGGRPCVTQWGNGWVCAGGESSRWRFWRWEQGVQVMTSYRGMSLCSQLLCPPCTTLGSPISESSSFSALCNSSGEW